MPKISPFLWFDTQAEEAANFYVSVFPNSKITSVSHYGEGMPGPAGSVMTVAFQLDGQEVVALNGGPLFKFSEAISLVVPCKDQAEIDRYWEALSAGGGKPGPCGWLTDRFGLSWQVVPDNMEDFITADQARTDRVMAAVMKMGKLDKAKMEAAAQG